MDGGCVRLDEQEHAWQRVIVGIPSRVDQVLEIGQE